jgi:hypothetical protein
MNTQELNLQELEERFETSAVAESASIEIGTLTVNL